MSAREELLALARRHMWAAWQLSSEELASQAAVTLDGLGMLVPEGGAQELEKLRSRVAELEVERHETNEIVSDSAEALRANRDRIAELEARLAKREQSAGTYPPALPWARLMDHEDLTGFLDELAASAITHASAETALTEVEDTCGRWRLIAEAQHAHNTAPGPDAEEGCDHPNGYGPNGCAGCGAFRPTDDDVTPQVTKLRALLADQRQQTGGA